MIKSVNALSPFPRFQASSLEEIAKYFDKLEVNARNRADASKKLRDKQSYKSEAYAYTTCANILRATSLVEKTNK